MSNTPTGWKRVQMSYNKRTNTVKFEAKESDFVPKYLDYLLEFHNIPKDAKRIFTK
jgi:hypothetical protein